VQTQYAVEKYRRILTRHHLVGSMGRRGNPYDNAKAESFIGRLHDECLNERHCHGNRAGGADGSG
jgi:putative transposase